MFKKLILSNGLRVVLAPQPGGLAATVLVLVEAGSEYETKSVNGISHFLEHLVFKGTERRPKPGMISQELDALGAEYNAFTSQEYTGYWAKAERSKTPNILELVSDFYLHPIFDEKEIDKERGVIIEEINMYEDTPMRRVQELFMTLLYGDQPAGWDIAGRKEIIRRLKRDDFIQYRSSRYLAPGTAVIVAGSFNERSVISQIKGLWSGLPKRKASPKPKTVETQRHPRVLVKWKDSDQAHLVLGMRAFSVFDKRRYALQVLSEVLGGGMSSRLFHRVREELGAAYYVRSAADLFLDHGFLEISAGVDTNRIHVVIEALLDELRRLARDLVPAAELQKSKDHMIGTLMLALETSDQIASFYGGQEITTGTLVGPESLIRRIRRVRAEDIRAVARSCVKDDKLNLAVIGPHKKEETFRKILAF